MLLVPDKQASAAEGRDGGFTARGSSERVEEWLEGLLPPSKRRHLLPAPKLPYLALLYSSSVTGFNQIVFPF